MEEVEEVEQEEEQMAVQEEIVHLTGIQLMVALMVVEVMALAVVLLLLLLEEVAGMGQLIAELPVVMEEEEELVLVRIRMMVEEEGAILDYEGKL